jgi:hypothetical protein
LTIAFLTFILLAFYVVQVGALNQARYQIVECERKLSRAAEKNKFLDIDFSKLSSLSNVTQKVDGSSFVKSDQIKYIKIFESSVVRNTR